MATVDLGKIKFVWRGAYNNSTAYTPDDVVSSGGSSYICIAASTGNAVSNGTYWNLLAQTGTDLTSTLGTQGQIVYRDGSGLAALNAGTAGQVLQTGGTGANPSWGTVSSEVVKLATGTFFTSSSSLNVDGYFNDSIYNCYKVMFSTQNTNSSGNTIRFRWRSSSSTLTGSNYYYASEIAYQNSGGSNDGQNGSWGDSHVPIGHFGNDNNERTTGEITLFHTTATAGFPQIFYKTYAKDGGSQFAMWTGACMFNGNATADGFQIYCPSGNFTQTGFWTLYGFKK
tara:strand:+ start:298 stop:1149 length:852 start_codon:yes stop_codon:yes gene_type:complete